MLEKLTKSEIAYAKGAAEDFAKPDSQMSHAAKKSLEKNGKLGAILGVYFSKSSN
jgi:hypothetical protein